MEKVYRPELTERDLGILEFILSMKFSSSDEVFRKFFRRLGSGEEAKSDAWAKKRLMQLERAGFLKAVYSFSDSKRYFVAMKDAYRAIRELRPDLEIGNPGSGFDLRTFDHDKLVLQARLNLEESLGVTKWISERTLRSEVGSAVGFSAKFVPDGIYGLHSGERVAFELEIAMKEKKRYQEKISRYISMIRRSAGSSAALAKVHYVVLKDSVSGLLRDQVRINPDYFQIDKFETLWRAERESSFPREIRIVRQTCKIRQIDV